MAEEEKTNKPQQTKSPLMGSQAQPTVLDATQKLDIDVNKSLIDSIIYSGLSGGLSIGDIEAFTSVSNSRDQIYQVIDTMAADSTVSAIVRTLADDVCEAADNGHIIWAESSDSKVSKFINYLLNVMNVDKNIYSWVYSLIKYGDVYLRLYRESDYEDDLFNAQNIKKTYSARNVLTESYKEELQESVNIHVTGKDDPYSYYVEMVADPSIMFELTKYGRTYGYVEVPNAKTPLGWTESMTMGTTATQAAGSSVYNYKMKSGDINIYQADDFVHACLEDGTTRFPETVDIFTGQDLDANAKSYSVRRGKSLLYDSFKLWREKTLLEASILLNRLTRSSIFRKVSVEVGDMPKEQVQQTLRRVKEMFEQKSAFNTNNGMSEYPNPGPIENFIYFATHNGQGAITVDSVGGDVNVKDIADLDWWNNKFYSSYGIPKQYFGWTDDGAGFNGGSALTVISSVYSKSVKRVQNAVVQMITDAINLILISKGYVSYLNNFVLKMRAPLSQEEKDYRENLSNRINAISNMNSLFSDVEDKARRLEIIKELVKTLNYGDELVNILDKEITAAKEAAKKAAAEAEAEKAAEADASLGEEPMEEPAEEPVEELTDAGDDLDLAPMPEAVETKSETQPLVEGPDFLNEEDDLPTPEEADENRDFSENN